MTKVYCCNCKYFWNNELGMGCNKVIGCYDTPESRMTDTAEIEIDNKNNNCKYYKPSLFMKLKILFKGEKSNETSEV
jgi:hypothetical protein